MYEAYFHLQKRPFSTTPDPSCVFAPEPVQELIDELILRAESGQGIAILTAPAGTGKTLLCRRIALEFSGRLTPIFLPNANFPTCRALLQTVLFELGKRYSGLEEQELRLAVFAALRESTRAGRGVVLIIDEAHLLSDRLLEELRLLAGLAEAEEPLARVILAGQPSLEEKLAGPPLEALNQRVACQVYLEPLTRQQSTDYIKFRTDWAGGECSRIFSAGALDRIAEACNGLPRCLNQLCDHVLLLTYVQEEPQVTAEAVDEALADLQQLPLRWNMPVALQPSPDRVDAGLDFADTEDADEVPSLPNVIAESAPESAAAETVCIEIGEPGLATGLGADWSESPTPFGALETPTPCSVQIAAACSAVNRPISGRTQSGSGALHTATQTSPRIFAEEVLDDRYAALDKGRRPSSRTFEDTFVPQTWLPGRQSGALPPSPPVPAPFHIAASDATVDDPRPDEQIDELLPLIAEAGGFGDGPADQSSRFIATRDLDFVPHLSDDVEFRPASVATQVESGILDACREVQTTVDSWYAHSGAVVNPVDSAQIECSGNEESRLPATGREYDVIEPNFNGNAADDFDPPDGSSPARTRSDATRVSGPKYRHVFSTLRRRLGNVRRPRQ
jgi:type II secretory pathway predicted ATPase ExeA